MKPVSGRRMCQVLQRRGWRVIRVKGSHFTHVLPGGPPDLVVVPVHGNHELRPGTQKDIMRAAGLTDADL